MTDDRHPAVLQDIQPAEPTAIIRFEARAEISVIWHHESLRFVIPPCPGAAGTGGIRGADRGP